MSGNKLRGIFTAIQLCLACSIYAQSHYPGQHTGKFRIQDAVKPAVSAFDLDKVELLDSRFKENMKREQKWLLSLSTERLLHGFRTNAGIYSGNEGGYFVMKKLGGWESLDCELRGHAIGHILSGLSLMYATTGENVYKLKADSLVSGLAEVQNVLDQEGYLSAYPQELINRNIRGQRVWAPWYTLHKEQAGLLDAYLYTNNQQALKIASKFADWAYNKLKDITSEQRKIMLRNEFGGINETFYNLYAITGKEQCKWLAQFFYHDEMLDPLKKDEDILEGKHANTFIPKLLGVIREYELEGNPDNRHIAEFFWNTVVDHHTFATGSNSDKEKFFKADQLSVHLSGYTGESCNVYNMLKLTRHLYLQTGEVKYINYYERALYNHILGQQDPETGMISYFLPMLPGAFKVYSTPENSFWCCVGSGFENQAKYGECIYYHDNEALFIDLFIPSRVNWDSKGFTIRQETSFPKNGSITLNIERASGRKLPLKIRYPYWAAGSSLKINGRNIKDAKPVDGYITLSRAWKKGDHVEINYGMQLGLANINDNPSVAAITYGPVVLAGQFGKANFTGTAPYSDPHKYNDYYTYDYQVPSNIPASIKLTKEDITKYIQRTKQDDLTFEIKEAHIVLKPLYDTHRERYVVYWQLRN